MSLQDWGYPKNLLPLLVGEEGGMPEVRWTVGPHRWVGVVQMLGGGSLCVLCLLCCFCPLGAIFCIHFAFLEDKTAHKQT